MEFVKIEDANLTLNRPQGWSEEQCRSVSAYAGVDGNGIPFVLTAIMPSEEDMRAMNEGRPIYLKFSGVVGNNGHPSMMPACLFTLDDKGQINL